MRRVMLGLLVLCSTASLDALPADVTFRWDYPQSEAAGYAFYCGVTSCVYTTRLDAGDRETVTLSLPEGSVHFCSVAAYDSQGVESPLSNEIAVSVSEDTAAVTVLPLLTMGKETSVMPTATGFRAAFSLPMDPRWLSLYASEQGAEGRRGCDSGRSSHWPSARLYYCQ